MQIGAPPHPRPWPDDPRLDPALLAEGDRRNVVDAFRYWREEAIVEALDQRRHPFHVALENWQRDPNIGAAVRNANAFLAAGVHIVGRRRWNRRGAMMTERYQRLWHHSELEGLLAFCEAEGLPLIGVDNLPGAAPLAPELLPEACVLLFGQEGPGLSPAAVEACERLVYIPQYGSTRSINAGAASAVIMHAWCSRWGRASGL